MRPLEELTYQGQVRRIRKIALQALVEREVQFDRLQLIFHGENTTFRARHRQGDHLVRVHRPGYQNRSTIRSELELLRALREQTDLIVPRPVGNAMTIGAAGVDPRDVVVFEWIDGRFNRKFTPFTMRRLGEFAAKLHLFAEQYDTPPGFDRNFHHLDGLLGENMGCEVVEWPADSRGLVDELVERAGDVFDDLGRSIDVWGIIHADLHHGNRLVCRGGELGAIDFDDAGFGHYLYDICVMLGYQRSWMPDSFDALLRAFLVGYRTHRHLSEEHVALLPAFFAMRRIAVTLWVLSRARDNPYFAERSGPEVARSVEVLQDLAGEPW